MNENLDLKLIRSKLPDNGMRLLEQKTELSRYTISRFFNGGSVKPSTETKILDAALELIKEMAEKSKERVKFVKSLAKEDAQQKSLNL